MSKKYPIIVQILLLAVCGFYACLLIREANAIDILSLLVSVTLFLAIFLAGVLTGLEYPSVLEISMPILGASILFLIGLVFYVTKITSRNVLRGTLGSR